MIHDSDTNLYETPTFSGQSFLGLPGAGRRERTQGGRTVARTGTRPEETEPRLIRALW